MREPVSDSSLSLTAGAQDNLVMFRSGDNLCGSFGVWMQTDKGASRDAFQMVGFLTLCFEATANEVNEALSQFCCARGFYTMSKAPACSGCTPCYDYLT